MDWNEKVRVLMENKNMTQKDLSLKSGITESSISRYLRGNKHPRMDILVNLAKALEVETNYLLDDNEKLDSAYNTISTAIARNGKDLTDDERRKLVLLLLGGKE